MCTEKGPLKLIKETLNMFHKKFLKRRFCSKLPKDCKLRFIPNTGPPFKKQEQAEQYTFSLYKSKQDRTPTMNQPLLWKILLECS